MKIQQSTTFCFSEFTNSDSEHFNPNINFVDEYKLRVLDVKGYVELIERKTDSKAVIPYLV